MLVFCGVIVIVVASGSMYGGSQPVVTNVSEIADGTIQENEQRR